MILTFIEWRNEQPWWRLADAATRTAVDEEGREYHRGRFVGQEDVDDGVWRRSGNIVHEHLRQPSTALDSAT